MDIETFDMYCNGMTFVTGKRGRWQCSERKERGLWKGVWGRMMGRHTSETSHRPHAFCTLPLGTCRINCCLLRACRLRAVSTPCIKETTGWTLWNFYSVCSFSSLFPLLFLPIPHLGPPHSCFKLCHQTDKKDFSSLPCFSAQLPSCPEAPSSISLVLSQLPSLLDLPGAKTWSRVGGIKRRKEVKKERGKLHQEVCGNSQ